MVTDGYHSTISPGCMLFITNYVCAVDFSAGFVYKPTHMHVANRFLPLEDVLFFCHSLIKLLKQEALGLLDPVFWRRMQKKTLVIF